MDGKARSAFRGGFLGIGSFGRSTLVQIVEASEADRANLVDRLTQHLAERHGAPDMAAARAAAEDEVTFAESLCSQPLDALVAVHRSFDNGEVRETFRTLRPRAGQRPARAFSFLEVEGEDEPPGETVDLVGLAAREPK